MTSKPLQIACLGWGSLIWDPKELPIQSEWFKNGPRVCIEYTRQSNNGCITLVIDPLAEPVNLLWARMIPTELSAARETLRKRERTKLSKIGCWQRGQSAPTQIPDLSQWADDQSLDAVIWTALEPKFNEEYRSPTINEVISYLRDLPKRIQLKAKEYIEKTPHQIDTYYRRQIETILGWSRRQS